MATEGFQTILLAAVVLLTAVIFYIPEQLIYLLLYVIIAFIIFVVVILQRLTQTYSNSLVQHSVDRNEVLNQELLRLRTVLLELLRVPTNPKRLPAVFGRMIDDVLQTLIDLTLRDFVGVWNTEQGFGSSEQLLQDIREDVWKVVQNLQERSSKVDEAKLICVDIANRILLHFEKIRLIDPPRPVTTDDDILVHLQSTVTEKEFLRQISSALIVLFFPHTYSTIEPVKHLLQEMLTCKVLFPAIETLTDPDFINMMILAFIEENQPPAEQHGSKSYERPDNFEDFFKLIRNLNDIDTLKRIRYDLVWDIMTAANAQHVERSPEDAKELKQFISNLTEAKNLCEKKLNSLGWMGYPVEVAVEASASVGIEAQHISVKKILKTDKLRFYLSQYLVEVEMPAYIGYWMAVEQLRQTPRTNWHSCGAEIFYTYIRSPVTPIKVAKASIKQMEEFLIGNGGIDVFYQVQDDVVQTLTNTVYPTFSLTELFKQMLAAAQSPEEAEETGENEENPASTSANDASTSVDQSNYTRHKLSQLENRLSNKRQALEALRNSLKPESRVLAQLEGEMESLQGELRQMEAHVMRTEEWGEHLGQWRAYVQQAEMSEDKECPQFVLVVHRGDPHDRDAVSKGWVVLRKLQDFLELHRKLSQLSKDVKALELPTKSLKYRLGKTTAKNTLEKAKGQIQKYLQFILEDERLYQSEALYTFLSPSSNHLKFMDLSKKNKFSIATLFKNNVWEQSSLAVAFGQTLKEPMDDDISLLVDDAEDPKNTADIKDPIAEPLYLLLNELCDLNSKFNWIRRTLITTIQLTYNRSINRAIRVIIREWFSEQNIFSCIQHFIKSWWPNDRLNTSTSIRSEDEKLQTRSEARKRILDNIPLLLSNLVGQQSARLAAIKVFDALQDPLLNKHIFYQILELVLFEIFPELKN